jgi:hypothetical protein
VQPRKDREMKRKTNPLIQAINEASSKSRREGHELISKAKMLEEKKMKIRANYSAILKDLDLSVHNLYMRTSYYKPTIDISMNKLESFKDIQLTTLLDFFTSQTEKVSTKDWANYLNRDYTFELEDVIVTISAYVRSDSPTCRKVQTGVKIEEVPQFELVCD